MVKISDVIDSYKMVPTIETPLQLLLKCTTFVIVLITIIFILCTWFLTEMTFLTVGMDTYGFSPP